MDYYESLTKEIFSRYETITSLTQQTKIKGDYTEAIVRDFVGRFLPRRYEVVHGLVYNSKTGKKSPECDVIVYDIERAAPLFKSEDLVIVDGNYVRIVMQVKSQLTSTTLKEAIKNLKLVKEINSHIIGWIVGFEAKDLLKTMYFNSWKSHVVQFLQIFSSKCKENPELLKSQMKFFVENLRNYAVPFFSPTYPQKNFVLYDFSNEVPTFSFRDNENEREVKRVLSDIHARGFQTVWTERNLKFQEEQKKKNGKV